MKNVVLLAFVAAAPLGLSAAAGLEHLVTRFDGGIGVQPVLINASTFEARANVVRGIGPGLLPWTINSLKARLDVDGELEAHGRGLVLAGGPPIGTRADLTSVRAILFCGTSTTAHVSPPGALDLDGDFANEGVLNSTVGPTCPTPTLLIVVGAGTDQAPFRCVAAGIPDNDDERNQ